MYKRQVLYNPRKVTAPFDAAAIRLETERLILRPMEPRDLTDLHEIASDPEIADMGGGACCKTDVYKRQRQNSSAVARPIPADAPVTMQTLFSNLPIISSSAENLADHDSRGIVAANGQFRTVGYVRTDSGKADVFLYRVTVDLSLIHISSSFSIWTAWETETISACFLRKS